MNFNLNMGWLKKLSLGKINVKQRLLLGAIVGVFVPVLIVSIMLGTVATKAGQTALEEQAKLKLIAIGENKKQQVENYFKTMQKQIITLSDDNMVINAMKEFKGAFKNHRRELNSTRPNVLSIADMQNRKRSLRNYYETSFVEEYQKRNAGETPDIDALLNSLNDDSIALQSSYISNNANELGSKDELNKAKDNTFYTRVHEKYHSHIRHFAKEFGYSDIYLVDPSNGDIIYSVSKQMDFTTSLKDGPYADSGLGRAYEQANALEDVNAFVTIDFDAHIPSYQDQVAFVASPIYDGAQLKVGILIFQTPTAVINDIMTSNQQWRDVGLGETGETYLVAEDKTLRNESRFMIEDNTNYLTTIEKAGEKNIALIKAKNSTIGYQTIETPGVDEALAGNTGFDIFPDYRGVSVLSAYFTLDIPGLRWVLMSELDEAEAFAAVASTRNTIIYSAAIISVIVILLAVFGAIWYSRAFTKPITRLYEAVMLVSEGDENARVRLHTQDEFGALGRAFDDMMDERLEIQTRMQTENEEINDSVVDLMGTVAQLAQRNLTIKCTVSENVTGPVADAVNRLTDEIAFVLRGVMQISNEVANSSAKVKQQSDIVMAVAAKEKDAVDQSSRELASAAKTMSGIAEIARNNNELANRAIDATTNALEQVNDTVDGITGIRDTIRETEKRIKRLGERSQEITGVVNLINTIAERTHILALNASMHAASAGEAGRGFAVVADEVQRLAENSREATQQISTLVKNIQVETADTINTMNDAITKVVEGSKKATLAGEQMKTTQEATNELVLSVQKIATQAVEQARISNELEKRAGHIRQSTQQTSQELLAQSVHTDDLVKHSRGLLNAVQAFTLPTVDAVH
jgi:methyl-accepting chemotaxis protein